MNWKSQVSSNRKHISNELLELRHLFISCNKKSWTCWAHTHNKELTVKMGFRFGWLSSSIIRFRFMLSLSLLDHRCCVCCVFGLLSSCGHVVLSVVGRAPCFLVSSQWWGKGQGKKWERETLPSSHGKKVHLCNQIESIQDTHAQS